MESHTGIPLGRPEVMLLFKQLDTDGDGRITKEELLAELGQPAPGMEDEESDDEENTRGVWDDEGSEDEVDLLRSLRRAIERRASVVSSQLWGSQRDMIQNPNGDSSSGPGMSVGNVVLAPSHIRRILIELHGVSQKHIDAVLRTADKDEDGLVRLRINFNAVFCFLLLLTTGILSRFTLTR